VDGTVMIGSGHGAGHGTVTVDSGTLEADTTLTLDNAVIIDGNLLSRTTNHPRGTLAEPVLSP